MLKNVQVGQKNFQDYKPIIGEQLYKQVKQLAKQFKGARVLHINATAHGGGVAQILQSFVPLQQSLGMNSHWQVIEPNNSNFYVVTKKIHNSLQGAKQTLTASEWKLYEAENKAFAKSLKPDDWDYIVIHDPQPAAILGYSNHGNAKWIWRCHVDLSEPNADTATKFKSYLGGYDGAIYTLKKYIPSGTGISNNGVEPVAIDPLNQKNKPLSREHARLIVAGYGVSCDQPLVVQISRFDPWKDPLGVIDAWEIARQEIPELQLVLMGDAADDDPEGRGVLEQVLERATGQDKIHIITDTNDEAVNAFQSLANVIIQKSLREGFGLTVTEALWAKTPVIGSKVGGIPEQIKHGKDGYLISSTAEAAKYIVKLINDPALAERMGLWGHEYVREHFLIPHMLKADLEFLQTM